VELGGEAGAGATTPVGRLARGWPVRLGPALVVAGEVRLRPVRQRDAAVWSALRRRDVNYLEPWEPDAPGTWAERHSRLAWPPQCAGLRSMARRGQAMPFAITLDGRFAGQLTIGNVVRGPLRSAWVGYWVARDLAGGGVATAAVALAADHCFGTAGLHRLEATVRPENIASLRVLGKLGFRDEGLHERYLEVGGCWRDHQVLAITAEEVGRGMLAQLVESGRARLPGA
jgi:ribosomal-protein-alanine N-acetyltransferase